MTTELTEKPTEQKTVSEKRKLHLGCGHEILPGYVNLDSAELPGVDVVHNLTDFPWPFKDNQFDDILIKHVLEHLPNTTQVLEELWRISAHGCKIRLRVPFWNSSDYITDPTHIRPFNEHTFEFFDPRFKRCQERSYYSKARFRINEKFYYARILGKYVPFKWRIFCWPLEFLARYLCNIIQVMEVELVALKEA